MKKLGLIAIGALIGATLCFFITGKTKVEELELIAFGALIGAILSFFATEISAWRRRKEDKAEKAINIIADVFKFVTKVDDIVNEIKSYSYLFSQSKLVGERRKSKFINIEEKINILYQEWEFHEFQLYRVNNKDLLEKFKALMTAHHAYLVFFLSVEFKPGVEKSAELEYLGLYDAFRKQCTEICRVDAPVCTPGAPGKKKGLAKNG